MSLSLEKCCLLVLQNLNLPPKVVTVEEPVDPTSPALSGLVSDVVSLGHELQKNGCR